MTRRTPSADSGEFGFDAVGAAFMVEPGELRKLLGLGPLAVAVYMRCLKPFTKGNGRVHSLSYYRLAKMLAHAQNERAGRPKADPTHKQLRTALDALEAAGLIVRSPVHNEERGVLQIWVSAGVGGSLPKSIRAGFRAGSKPTASRASA